MPSMSSYFNPGTEKVIRGQKVKKIDSCFVFPRSPKDLWDDTPQGESFIIGFQHYPCMEVVCGERCIRLAHKHARQEVERGATSFRGFLIGSLRVVGDESGIVVTLDRFDPGIVGTDDVIKRPSAILPDDIIVPVQFTLGQPDNEDDVYSCTTADFKASIQVLHKSLSSPNLDISKSLPIHIHCYHTMHDDVTVAGLLIRCTGVVASNPVELTPTKPIPVIPTALAKNLAAPLTLCDGGGGRWKSGFMTMDQTRKILLLLDSDPKVSRLPTVGVWVSGVLHPYHPYVLMACIRYMQYNGLRERILCNDNFLVAIYSISCSKPTFHSCKMNGDLNFELLSAQQYVHMYQPNDASSAINMKFISEPPDGSRDRAMFAQALQELGPFAAPANKKPLEALQPIDDITNKSEVVGDMTMKQCNQSFSENEENIPPTQIPLNPRKPPAPREFPSPAPTPTSKHELHDLQPSLLEPSLIFQEGFTPHVAPPHPLHLRVNPSNHRTRSHSVPQATPLTPNTRSQPHKHASRTPKPQPNPTNPRHYDAKLHNAYKHTNQPHSHASPMLTRPHSATPPTQPPMYPPKTPNPKPPMLTRPHSATPRTQPPMYPQNPPNPRTQPPSYPQNPPNPTWMQHLPPEAFQLLLQQDSQLQQLQTQVQLLISDRSSHDDHASHETRSHDSSASSGSSHAQPSHETTQDSRDQDHHKNSREYSDMATQTDREIPVTKNTIATNTEIMLTKDETQQWDCDVIVQDIQPAPSTSRSATMEVQMADDAQDTMETTWEEQSINIGEINQVDESVASSIRVDMPGLDDKPQWGHDSPVLGESASMYSRVKPTADDDQFFGNLLKQVQTMLKNADIDIGSDASSSISGCTADDNGCHGDDNGNYADDRKRHDDKPKLKPRKSRQDRVVAATRKQLRKMGVSLKRESDQTLCIMKESNRCLGSVAAPLVPHLAYLSMLADDPRNNGSSSEMSIHANAIALKYLSDDQLMKIAPGNPPVVPSMPGMSLISPTNMTMGTRRYMQKYGLIDGQDSDEEDSRGASPAFDRPPDVSREKQPSNQWSQLQNKLGETIDMVAPFLQDLGRNPQNPPSYNERLYDPRGYDSNLSKTASSDHVTAPRVVEQDIQVLPPHLVQALSNRQTHTPCDQTDQSDEVLMPPPTNYHRRSATLRSSRSPSADHFVAPQHRISPQSGNSPRNYPGNSPRNYPGDSPRNHPGNSPQKNPGNSPRNHPGNSPRNYPRDSPRNPPDKSPSTNPGKSPRPRCSSPQVNFTNVLDMNKIKQLKKLS